MMAGILSWWRELSPREQRLLGVMGVLTAIVFLWLGVARPVESGLKNARARYDEALDRNAAIRNKVAVLERLPRGAAAAPTAPVAQIVTQSAGEAGFTLERSQEQGNDRVEIAIASVRPAPLFGWITGLEAQGVTVESFSAQPAATAGSISVQAVLKARGQ